MLTNVFRLHGLPVDVVSDRGPQFTSIFWREFCALVGASASLLSGFHPKSNVQTERMNQELETALRCMASQHPSSCAPTASSPPVSLTWKRRFPACRCKLSSAAVVRTWTQARAALLRSSDRYTEAANRRRSQAPTYRVGKRVWLSTQDLPLRVELKKLAPKFVGPFEIQRIINPVAIRLKLPRSMRVHPTFHVSRIKPVC
ncbi:hypothetical protein L3Q82_017664 [Scortum barcoo]|uniref:Uncharacterized protein n=1 Tax=Scortum barcoo TaxID=214431 RepID=A0ACB8VLA1_9TELE|nr:hypothetical protein L3Q82_017664 [Scortum barcoo]